MKSNFSLVIPLIAGNLLIACIAVRAAETNDLSINLEIFKIILANDSMAPSGLAKFQTKNGVVTIFGNTPTLANKKQADDVIAKIPGVVSVDDRRLTLDSSPKQTAEESADEAQKIHDKSLTYQTQSTVAFDHSNDNLLYSVATTNGVVTISGSAKDETVKNRITQLAQEIKGVKSVVNNMDIP